MKRLVATIPSIACLALAAACVPTDEEKFPRGGIAVTLAPSEATAGIPFVSRDGWTVTIEDTALRVNAVAQTFGSYYGPGSGAYVVNPRYVCELRVSGLPPGPSGVGVQLITTDPRWQDQEDDVEVCAVDARTAARFRTYADGTEVTPEMLSDDYSYGLFSPSVYVRGRAEKAGRVVTFDLALAVNSLGQDFGEFDDNGQWTPSREAEDSLVQIEPNKGAPVTFEVHVERMFASGIDPLAEADANGDGRITAVELKAVPTVCSNDDADDDDFSPYPSSPSPLGCSDRLEELTHEASSILATHPTKR